ncbi:MAG: response regulator [Gemmatimonadaceae bacterium]|nr:response regulator [Gemmatimonadaceae bacterium]
MPPDTPFPRHVRRSPPGAIDLAARAPRGRRLAVGAVLAYAAFYCAVIAARLGEDLWVFENLAFLPLYLAAGVGVLLGARRPGLTRREVLAWRLVGWGWVLSFIGATAYVLPESAAATLIADVFYKSYYPLLVAGFVLLSDIDRPRAIPVRAMVEVGVVVVAAVTLSWYFVWSLPQLQDGLLQTSWYDDILALGEVSILIAAGIALICPRNVAARRPLELLGLGALLASVGDLILVRGTELESILLRQGADILLAGSTVLFTLAGVTRPSQDAAPTRAVASFLPFAAMSAVGALVLVEIVRGGVATGATRGLILGAVVLTSLVIARLVVAERATRAHAVELEAQEARFRALAQRSAEALILVDNDGIIRYSSESASRVFGASAAELEGRRLDAIGVGADSALQLAVARPSDGELVAWGATVQGTTHYFETVVSDRRDDAAIAGLILTTRDVSERTQLERRLLQSQKYDALGLLAGGVAHDFNNLLTTIRVNANLAQLTPAVDPTHELREIQLATERGAALCHQLLTFGRPGHGERTVVDLSLLLHELMPMLRRVVPATIALELRVAEPGTVVHVDRSQVEVAILNLVMNARDAVGAIGKISLDAVTRRQPVVDERTGRVAGDYVELSVTDDGVGMDDETLERVFEPFFSTKGSRGTGLGLAMVYGTMKGFDGNVEIESALGAGTTLRLIFPRVSARTVDEADDVVDEGATPSRSPSSRLVLLVEDERSVRQSIAKWLRFNGFTVVESADGVEALEALERTEWRVDAMLSDLSMPRMSGAALCAAVRDRLPLLPIFLMSGFASPALHAEASIPADIIRLRKPFDLAELSTRLHEMVG